MWIPHTIPPVVLRAYTPGDHRTDLETLQRQYDGRILRSEDPEWHLGVFPKKEEISLALLCLEMIIDGYEYYVQLTKCRNYILQKKLDTKDHVPNGDSMETSVESLNSRTKSSETISNSKIVASKEENTLREFQKIPNVLDILTDLQRVAVIEELDVEEIPFHIAVETIPDEYYWQRAVATLFPNKFKCDTTWRKTYLRLYTENYIELFNPREDNLNHLVKIINLVSAEVTILKIEQILPYCYGAEKELAIHVPFPDDDELGVGAAAEFDEGFPKADAIVEKAFRKQSMAIRKDSEVPESEISSRDFPLLQLDDRESRLSASDINLSSVRSNSLASGKENLKSEKSDASQSELEVEEVLQPLDRSSHLDFNEIIPLLNCLKEISLVFEVKNVGFEWDDSFFKFTDEDCNNLAKALGNSPTIEILEINRSHINGAQFNTLVEEGIINMPRLKKINMSYNHIADIGAKAISHLMDNGKFKTLETILLGRNKISDEGAKYIGESLKSNDHVLNIDLRLNFIGHDGCEKIAEGLEYNKRLERISLCGNRLDSSSCVSIGKMLCKNNHLKEIDLSCNILKERGGEYLHHAVQHNNDLRKINLRLTDIGYDLEYNIVKCVENTNNRNISDEDRERGLELIKLE